MNYNDNTQLNITVSKYVLYEHYIHSLYLQDVDKCDEFSKLLIAFSHFIAKSHLNLNLNINNQNTFYYA